MSLSPGQAAILRSAAADSEGFVPAEHLQPEGEGVWEMVAKGQMWLIPHAVRGFGAAISGRGREALRALEQEAE